MNTLQKFIVLVYSKFKDFWQVDSGEMECGSTNDYSEVSDIVLLRTH